MKLIEILYWRDVRITGALFLASMLLLTSFNHFTVVTVITYLLMITLVPPLIYRLAFSLKAAVLKTECEHPFREWLQCDIESFIGEGDKTALPKIVKNVLTECRRVVLVEDTIDTCKVLAIVYVMSYLGEWFSGITLMYLVVITTFSAPKIYDMYRSDIQNMLNKLSTMIEDLKKRIFSSIPSKTKTSGAKQPVKNSPDREQNVEEIGQDHVADEENDKEKIS